MDQTQIQNFKPKAFRRFPTLRIKAATLAAETRIIRNQEKAAKKAGATDWLNTLCNHRKHTVRRAARETQLALAYLRGRAYLSVENRVCDDKILTDNQIKDIWAAVYRHAAMDVPGESVTDVQRWVELGKLRPVLVALQTAYDSVK